MRRVKKGKRVAGSECCWEDRTQTEKLFPPTQLVQKHVISFKILDSAFRGHCELATGGMSCVFPVAGF